jgi:hypothetical protein
MTPDENCFVSGVSCMTGISTNSRVQDLEIAVRFSPARSLIAQCAWPVAIPLSRNFHAMFPRRKECARHRTTTSVRKTNAPDSREQRDTREFGQDSRVLLSGGPNLLRTNRSLCSKAGVFAPTKKKGQFTTFGGSDENPANSAGCG